MVIAGLGGIAAASTGWIVVLWSRDHIIADLIDDNERQASRLANATAQALNADRRAIAATSLRAEDAAVIERLNLMAESREALVATLDDKIVTLSLKHNALLAKREAEKAGSA